MITVGLTVHLEQIPGMVIQINAHIERAVSRQLTQSQGLESPLAKTHSSAVHGQGFDVAVIHHLPTRPGIDRQRVTVDDIACELSTFLQGDIEDAGVKGDEIAIEATVVDFEVGGAPVFDF